MIGQCSWLDSRQYGNDINGTTLLGHLLPPSVIKNCIWKQDHGYLFDFSTKKRTAQGYPPLFPPSGIGAHVGPGSVGGVGSEMGQDTATPLRLVVGAVPKLTKLKIQEEILKQRGHWT